MTRLCLRRQVPQKAECGGPSRCEPRPLHDGMRGDPALCPAPRVFLLQQHLNVFFFGVREARFMCDCSTQRAGGEELSPAFRNARQEAGAQGRKSRRVGQTRGTQVHRVQPRSTSAERATPADHSCPPGRGQLTQPSQSARRPPPTSRAHSAQRRVMFSHSLFPGENLTVSGNGTFPTIFATAPRCSADTSPTLV